MPTANYVALRAAELLAAAQASLTLARAGSAVPPRAYRSHGPPAVDFCETDLLVVYLDNPALRLSDPSVNRSMQAGQFESLPVARFVVELWRCVPNLDGGGTPPTATELDSSAAGLETDMHALWTGLWLSQAGGTLFPAGMGCAAPNFGDPVPLPPQGSMAGWRMRVEYPVSDAGPPL